MPRSQSVQPARRPFAVIESPCFWSEVCVVSGYSQFVDALAARPEVQDLLARMREPADTVEVFSRTLGLLRARYDPSYLNPSDAAVAAYLWVLERTAPDLARLAAGWVRGRRDYWWARKLAERVIQGRPPSVKWQSATRVVPRQGAVGTATSHSAASGTVFLGMAPGGASDESPSTVIQGWNPQLGVVYGTGRASHRNPTSNVVYPVGTLIQRNRGARTSGTFSEVGG